MTADRDRETRPAEARTGADLIAAERRRQVEAEGWTAEHDRQRGHAHELMSAGQAYLRRDHTRWPWRDGWKPKSELRNLVRAGALFQAALDTGDLTALAGNAEGFRNVCACMIDEGLADVLTLVPALRAAGEGDRLRRDLAALAEEIEAVTLSRWTPDLYDVGVRIRALLDGGEGGR